jgi:GT2 family glycosyltransferase
LIATSIIIPSYNGKELVQSCVESIRKHTKEPYEIIVVDNGSEDRTIEYCLDEKITFVSLPMNVGFPGACNIGMKVASGDALLLLNNDVVVTENWLSNMLKCLCSSREIGIVGPCTNEVSGNQQVERLVGFCFLIKRELVERIGYLDEQFAPGYYEDDDYCHRAKQAGYELRIAGDVLVYHRGTASFKPFNKGDGAPPA